MIITRTLAGDSLAEQADLRIELLDWLRKAQAAGLGDEDITALVDTTIRAARQADTLQEEPAGEDTRWST